jgi:glycosyltransferase involved in cell wall biosynthesis
MLIDAKLPVIYARIEQNIPWNYNGACNLGVWLSRGDYLAFEDNDNIPQYDWYEQAIEVLENNPNIGRVQARNRKVIPLDDLLNKPKKDWVPTRKKGANMGTAMFPRDIYLFLKGQDERMTGRYGWMYYDWRQRLLNRAKVGFSSIGDYYYIDEGQSNLSRFNHPQNLGFKRDNDRSGRAQGPEGILQFTYTYEKLAGN